MKILNINTHCSLSSPWWTPPISMTFKSKGQMVQCSEPSLSNAGYYYLKKPSWGVSHAFERPNSTVISGAHGVLGDIQASWVRPACEPKWETFKNDWKWPIAGDFKTYFMHSVNTLLVLLFLRRSMLKKLFKGNMVNKSNQTRSDTCLMTESQGVYSVQGLWALLPCRRQTCSST